jgi:hypothetical protein
MQVVGRTAAAPITQCRVCSPQEVWKERHVGIRLH